LLSERLETVLNWLEFYRRPDASAGLKQQRDELLDRARELDGYKLKDPAESEELLFGLSRNTVRHEARTLAEKLRQFAKMVTTPTVKRKLRGKGKSAGGDTLVLQGALLKHHGYGTDEFNWTPATQKDLKKLTGWHQSKVSRTMKELFGSKPMKTYNQKCAGQTIRGFLQKFDDGTIRVEAISED